MSQSVTKGLCGAALCTALLFVFSLIRIPVGLTSFTLQTCAVMITACLLKSRYALLAVGAYTLLGLFGVPLFLDGGGFAYVIRPTFGFILAFFPFCAVMPFLVRRALGKSAAGNAQGQKPGFWKPYLTVSALLFAGAAAVLAIGTAYAAMILTVTSGAAITDWWAFAVGYGIMFLPFEAAKALLAAYVAVRVGKWVNRDTYA